MYSQHCFIALNPQSKLLLSNKFMIYKTNRLQQSYSKLRSPFWTFQLLCQLCGLHQPCTDSKAKPSWLWHIWRKFLLPITCPNSDEVQSCFGLWTYLYQDHLCHTPTLYLRSPSVRITITVGPSDLLLVLPYVKISQIL